MCDVTFSYLVAILSLSSPAYSDPVGGSGQWTHCSLYCQHQTTRECWVWTPTENPENQSYPNTYVV